MKKILLIMMIFFATLTGHAQDEQVVYFIFSSTKDAIDGKVQKKVNSLNTIDAEPSISFILEDKTKEYSMRFSHHRHKHNEVSKRRRIAADDLMEVKLIKKDILKNIVIDLDEETENWTKEDAWAFTHIIASAKKVYFIDRRDIKDSVCLARQVKLISSNRPTTDMIILDEKQKKELDKLPVRKILNLLPDSLKK